MSDPDIACPYCSTEMTPYQAEDVVLDACSHCGGVWFDPGELKPFYRSVLTEGVDIPSADYSGAEDPIPAEDVESDELACPRCVTILEKFNYGYDSNILLDRCPQCGGLWAEQDAVVELAAFMKGDHMIDRLHAATAHFVASTNTLPANLQPPMPVSELIEFARVGQPLFFTNKSARFSRELFRGIGSPAAPWSLVLILVINTVVTGVVFSSANKERLLLEFGLVPSAVLDFEHWAAPFTYFLLHISPIQIFVNSLFFLIFSRVIVADLGNAMILLMYFPFGVAAGILHALSTTHPETLVVGSVGALAGIAGFSLAWEPRAFLTHRIELPLPGLPPVGYLIVWILWLLTLDLFLHFTDLPQEVNWGTRIGVFLIGAGSARISLKVRSLKGWR